MSSQQDKHENPEQKNKVDTLNANERQQNQSARRALLKAAWVAPVVFSVTAHQAFAGSPMQQRR